MSSVGLGTVDAERERSLTFLEKVDPTSADLTHPWTTPRSVVSWTMETLGAVAAIRGNFLEAREWLYRSSLATVRGLEEQANRYGFPNVPPASSADFVAVSKALAAHLRNPLEAVLTGFLAGRLDDASPWHVVMKSDGLIYAQFETIVTEVDKFVLEPWAPRRDTSLSPLWDSIHRDFVPALLVLNRDPVARRVLSESQRVLDMLETDKKGSEYKTRICALFALSHQVAQAILEKDRDAYCRFHPALPERQWRGGRPNKALERFSIAETTILLEAWRRFGPLPRLEFRNIPKGVDGQSWWTTGSSTGPPSGASSTRPASRESDLARAIQGATSTAAMAEIALRSFDDDPDAVRNALLNTGVARFAELEKNESAASATINALATIAELDEDFGERFNSAIEDSLRRKIATMPDIVEAGSAWALYTARFPESADRVWPHLIRRLEETQDPEQVALSLRGLAEALNLSEVDDPEAMGGANRAIDGARLAQKVGAEGDSEKLARTLAALVGADPALASRIVSLVGKGTIRQRLETDPDRGRAKRAKAILGSIGIET